MRGTVYFSAFGADRRFVIELQGILCASIALAAWIAVAIGGLFFVLLPRYHAGLLHIVVILGLALLILDILFRFGSIITNDPGIVSHDSEPANSTAQHQNHGFRFVPQSVDSESGSDLKNTSEFCSKCKRSRPARAHHCSKCGHCIRKMDHHCPWINNCVGERNHGHFLSLLRRVMALCLIGSVFLALEFFYFPPVELSYLYFGWSNQLRDRLLTFYIVLDVICTLAVTAFLIQQHRNKQQDKTTIEKKIEYWKSKSLKSK